MLIALFFIASCGSGGGTTSTTSTDTDTDTDTTTNEYPQNTLYSDILWATYGGIWDIWNQNIAGTYFGSRDETVNCPLGGTVHITGTSSYSSSTEIVTIDLNYDMTDCIFTKVWSSLTVSLTLTGTINFSGGFRSDTSSFGYWESTNIQSTALAISGTAQRSSYDDATINNTCDLNGSKSASSDSSTYTGIVCGESVSWVS